MATDVSPPMPSRSAVCNVALRNLVMQNPVSVERMVSQVMPMIRRTALLSMPNSIGTDYYFHLFVYRNFFVFLTHKA